MTHQRINIILLKTIQSRIKTKTHKYNYKKAENKLTDRKRSQYADCKQKCETVKESTKMQMQNKRYIYIYIYCFEFALYIYIVVD